MGCQTHSLIGTGMYLFADPSVVGGEQASLTVRAQLFNKALRCILSPGRAGAALLGKLEQLGSRIRVARAELAAFEGRLRENLESLPLLVGTDPLNEERRLQLTAQSLLLEARILAGHDDGGELARLFVRQLFHPRTPYIQADAALLRVELACLLTGCRSDAAFQQLSTMEGSWSFRCGSPAELSKGVDLLEQDRPSGAGLVLRALTQQLGVVDLHGVLIVAAAALTHSYRDESSPQRMVAHLPLSDAGGGSSWLVRRDARFDRTGPADHERRRRDGAVRLYRDAADDLERGAGSWAPTGSAAAVGLGRREAIADLDDLTALLQGLKAQICRLYARALVSSDPKLLAHAVTEAAAVGEVRLARLIAGDAPGTKGRNGAGRPNTDLDPQSRTRQEPDERLGTLTVREREIAALAWTGESNRGIAGTVFLTVRTVEGHLYRMYSKLGFSTRAELTALLLPDSAR